MNHKPTAVAELIAGISTVTCIFDDYGYIDKAAFDKVVAIALKLEWQRDVYIEFYSRRSTVTKERAVEIDNEQLREIIKGEK